MNGSPDEIELPRFVRPIGVFSDDAGVAPDTSRTIGVLRPFDGVLGLAITRSGEPSPALSYLALGHLLDRGERDRVRHSDRRGGSRDTVGASPRNADRPGTVDGSPSVPDERTELTVSHLLRGDVDGRPGEGRPAAGTTDRGGRPAGDDASTPVRTGADDRDTGRASDAPDRSDADDRETDAGTADGGHSEGVPGDEPQPEPESIRELRRLGRGATILGDRPDGFGISPTLGEPRTVLATAPMPTRIAGASSPGTGRSSAAGGGYAGRRSLDVTAPGDAGDPSVAADRSRPGHPDRSTGGDAPSPGVPDEQPGGATSDSDAPGSETGDSLTTVERGRGESTERPDDPTGDPRDRSSGPGSAVDGDPGAPDVGSAPEDAGAATTDPRPAPGGTDTWAAPDVPALDVATFPGAGTAPGERPPDDRGAPTVPSSGDVGFRTGPTDGSPAGRGRAPVARGRDSIPQVSLTVLEGNARDDRDGRDGASDRGRDGRGGAAGTAPERTADPRGSDRRGSQRPSRGGRDAGGVGLPEHLSLEGGGPDSRFIEELYRELMKKMRNERDRRGY